MQAEIGPAFDIAKVSASAAVVNVPSKEIGADVDGGGVGVGVGEDVICDGGTVRAGGAGCGGGFEVLGG